MTDTLATAASAQMVPGEFAEKAMASLMQMHTELMDEKERRVELYRKLMEREQTVAELRMYVKMLEEKLQPARPEPVVAPAPMPPRPVEAAAQPIEPSPHVRAPHMAPPSPPRVKRRHVDGWKTW